MKSRKAFITGHHPYAFRCGHPAEIIGVVMCNPPESTLTERACFHVRFADGVEDFIPLSDFSALTGVEAYVVSGSAGEP